MDSSNSPDTCYRFMAKSPNFFKGWRTLVTQYGKSRDEFSTEVNRMNANGVWSHSLTETKIVPKQ